MKIKLKGYLEKSSLDKDGAKHITFEFTARDAVETAKLELMGRDLRNYLPVLLEVTVENAKEEKPHRTAARIRNAGSITRED